MFTFNVLRLSETKSNYFKQHLSFGARDHYGYVIKKVLILFLK